MNTGSRSASAPGELPRLAWLGLVGLIPLTIFAFWRSYFGILDQLPEGTGALVHSHAGVQILWLLMLIAQAWFVRTKRWRLHRWVGRSSFLVVPAIFLVGLATTHASFNKPVPHGTTFEELRSLDLITLGILATFVLTWWLAMVNRGRTVRHVRFIISTLFAMVSAIVFRVFYYWVPGFGSFAPAVIANGVVILAILTTLIIRDRRGGLKRSPYWVVASALAILHLGYFTVARTEPWFAFCRWFAALPLT